MPYQAPTGLSLLAAACLQGFATHALSQAAPTPPAEVLVAEAPAQQVEITARHYDNSVGSSDAASQGVIRSELLKSRPALRPGEVLEFVPGLIVTQHSGDGKANQYFLRGFNLDHGTDFATTVNGLPVNMPSHGHGQGYSDLNFLIPELVDRIEYRKGPYFATHGDFASAGAADIVYRQTLEAPFAALTLGENGYRRAVGAASFSLAPPDTTLLGAVEVLRNDGPWTVPEDLRKNNAVLTLAQGTRARGFSASLMGYDARWTSTDQVPQALIDAGIYNGQPFGRFDSLDPTDGGSSSRYSLSGEWHQRGDDSETHVAAYAMRYRLKLFSNFTYALERGSAGDQFSQQDSRSIYGLSASHAWNHSLGGLEARTEVGAQWRYDNVRVGLFTTQAREITGTTRDDRVEEGLAGLYAQTSVGLTPWLRGVVGVRADAGRFNVENLQGGDSGDKRDTQVSPKLSLIAGPWQKTEFFFNAGRGFHSNDARGVTAATDPAPGLAASRGWEVGARTEALPGLQSSLALWKLDFDSELVYVGDAGATEASGASKRRGVEWNNRYTPLPWLLVDADFAWTHARFANGDRIPNAVDQVASVAATLRELYGWSASLQWRYLGSGALIEDNSERSRPSSTFNLRVARQLGAWLGRGSELTLDVFNLFDRKVDDIQYFYEYQLPNAEDPAKGRIVHPAEPRSVRLTLRVGF